MNITKIKLNNFRNYEEQEIQFEKEINTIYGENAAGKTNILESIFLAGMGKSFRTNKDRELINLKKQNARVEIYYEKKDRKGEIKVEINDKKNIYLNKIKIKKFSEILGNINIVIFRPDDIEILKNRPI